MIQTSNVSWRELARAGGVAAALVLAAGAAQAAGISGGVVKIGVTNDQSGIYSAAGGMGAVIAARLAADEFGNKVLGKPIQIVFADNQSKPDVGVAIVTRWLDEDHVDVVVDGGSSAVGVAVQNITRQKNKIFLISGSGTTTLTNEQCSPVGFQWSWDSYGLAAGTANALVKKGLKSWFFITADYNFGHVLEQQAADVVKANGGKVLGAVRHPFNTPDFSSYLLQAQGSGAKVVALANAGGDASNAIKQAHEFGLTKGGQTLAALLLNITDVHALGLKTAQGLTLTTSFYWDRNAASRAFSKRFMALAHHEPTFLQAGAYSAVKHYLQSVKAAGTDDTDAVVKEMKKLPINDAMTDNGSIRVDGKVMRDMYLVQVKTPAESKGPWDYYKILATIPAKDAALPLKDSKCPLVTAAMKK